MNSSKEESRLKINELIKKAVNLGADVYFNAEDKVSKTMSAVQVPKEFLRDNLKNLFEDYRIQIVSEVKLKNRNNSQGENSIMSKKVIATKNAPEAIGPYSQAVEKNGTVYLSGQIPLDPSTMEVVSGGVEEQTEQVFKNIQAVLTEASLSWNDILKTTVYLANMDDFAKVNAIYSKYFEAAESFPARVCIEASKLPKGVLVEIDAIAAR